jgi:hypothetical protein
LGEAVPAAKTTPSSTEEAGGSSESRLRLLILGGAGLFGASILFGLFRSLMLPNRSRRGAGGQRSSVTSDVAVRPDRDGFWVTAPERLRGHTLQYRVGGSSGLTRGSVELEPNLNGQFVYTGYRPESVSVEQVLAVGIGVAAGVALTVAQRRQQEEDDQARGIAAAPDAFRRPYPPAYY